MTPRPVNYGSPEHWRRIEMEALKRWAERWMSSLSNDISLDKAIKFRLDFALLRSEIGMPHRFLLMQELARGGRGVGVLCKPVLKMEWEKTAKDAGVKTVRVESIYKARLWSHEQEALFVRPISTLIIDVSFSDKTKLFAALSGISKRFNGPVVTDALLMLTGQPPAEVTSALKLIGKPPVPVVWMPRPTGWEPLDKWGTDGA